MVIYNIKIEDEKNHGIYIIKNIKNGKVYIGQTRAGFRKRFLKHVSGFKCNSGHTQKFIDDYKIYGQDSFVFEILEIENDDSKLDNLERKYIKMFNSVENGYNTQEGGNSYYKDKRVKDMKRPEREYDQVFRKIRSEYMKNRVVTDETKERIRYANLGSKSPVAVLNESLVAHIKEDLVHGDSIKEVATRYGQKYSTISSISHERSWGHIIVPGWDDYIRSKASVRKRHILTEEEVRKIRALLAEGYNESQVARMYGCSSSKINGIHRGITFKDVK